MMAILRMTICWHHRRHRLRRRLQHLLQYLGVSILYLPFLTFHRQCLTFLYILLPDHHLNKEIGAGAEVTLLGLRFRELPLMVNRLHHHLEVF